MAPKSAPPVPRKRPRQERATFTVDAIVTAVERVLDLHGAAGLTTNRVAEVAGVSIGTLYHYFPNKAALVGSLQERVLVQVLSSIRAVLTAADCVPIPLLAERLAQGLVAIYRTQRPMHQWLVELRTAAAFQEPYRRYVDLCVAELAAFLARRPDVHVRDPAIAAFALTHAVEGVLNGVALRPGAVDLDALANEMTTLVVAYLR